MAEYLFVLGRTSSLCQAELKAVLTRKSITFQTIFSSPEILHISTPQPLDSHYLIKVLGGTIKIAEVAGVIDSESEEIIVYKFATLIQSSTREEESKTCFGLSGYNGISINVLKQWSKKLKERLEKTGLMPRFILPREETAISSVVVKKQKVFEIIIVNEDRKLIFARTLVLQDFEDWGKRDFARPAPNPHQGMLPPKVARMMVNLGNSKFEIRNSKFVLLDPFCGVGTILAEGMMEGCKMIGSDQSIEAIDKTRKNLEWLVSQYRSISVSQYQLFVADATHLSEKLPALSIDSIVTEPYLGPMFRDSSGVSGKKMKNVILGLEKLYLGCFRDWLKVLKSGGRVVIALPSFRVDRGEFFVKKAIDTCETLGYTLVSGPYYYSRPGAIVTRNIYVLGKK